MVSEAEKVYSDLFLTVCYCSVIPLMKNASFSTCEKLKNGCVSDGGFLNLLLTADIFAKLSTVHIHKLCA
jgi:hypothetical protein